ncbi:unnamed protein product [Rhizoctonia solani]|uniref:Peptidase C14 caspase domain-containing protein n=1 Tax=Rhizoctonia solani TaxID=456999 RepID=A0A8H3A5Y1_9AGAM|nr:unnamed protein product [Rhizoctonia solani]
MTTSVPWVADLINTSVDEVDKNIVTVLEGSKPPIYAVIIGINDYRGHKNLKGAVPDADHFETYLREKMSVPSDQIISLRDKAATRAEIIRAFKALIDDTRIQRQDPIVIYYAGHGTRVIAPRGWEAGGNLIEALVPHDAGLLDEHGNPIYVIPDKTISHLVNGIARVKGDNIAVIFDSCHSASASRTSWEDFADVNTASRHITDHDLPEIGLPLPSDLDTDIYRLSITPFAMFTPEHFRQLGMRSHVLLAACGSLQEAYENTDTCSGYFTQSLLETLQENNVDHLTYSECLRRLPILKTPKPQNPVCEGQNSGRIFFNAKSFIDLRFITIEKTNEDYFLKAGVAQGVTPGTLITVYASHRHDSISLGSLAVIRSEPFRSQLQNPAEACPPFVIPPFAYGKQVVDGSSQGIGVYFSVKLQQQVRGQEATWKKIFTSEVGGVVIRPTDEESADVVVDIDSQGRAVFRVNDDKFDSSELGFLSPPVPLTSTHVLDALGSMARWRWHLERAPTSHPFQRSVQVEFTLLQPTAPGSLDLEPKGRNILDNLSGTIVVHPDDLYGMKLINKSTRDLFVYVFYFDVSSQEIKPWFMRSHGSSEQIDPPLRSHSTLTLGYGSGGEVPVSFMIPQNPTNFDSIEQPSPFNTDSTSVPTTVVDTSDNKSPSFDHDHETHTPLDTPHARNEPTSHPSSGSAARGLVDEFQAKTFLQGTELWDTILIPLSQWSPDKTSWSDVVEPQNPLPPPVPDGRSAYEQLMSALSNTASAGSLGQPDDGAIKIVRGGKAYQIHM